MDRKLKVCFVCSGNTCRSIMAERIFKSILKNNKIDDVDVFSKGLNAKGENITENAKYALKELGVNSRDRKSIMLKKTEPDVLYVAMTDEIKNKISGKVVSIKDLTGFQIFDPYGQSIDVYRKTAQQLEDAGEILLKKIIKIRGEK